MECDPHVEEGLKREKMKKKKKPRSKNKTKRAPR
jgi:hypothetical protein